MADKKIPTPQEHVDALVKNAQKALEEFMSFDQETIDNIVHEMALAGLAKQRELAKMAVEETGRGIYEDKITKNIFATEYIWHSIKYDKTVGIIEDNDRYHCRRHTCNKPNFYYDVQEYFRYQNPEPDYFWLPSWRTEVFFLRCQGAFGCCCKSRRSEKLYSVD